MKKRNNYIDNIIKGLKVSIIAMTCMFIFDITNEKYVIAKSQTEMFINILEQIKKTNISYAETKRLATIIILDLKLGLKV